MTRDIKENEQSKEAEIVRLAARPCAAPSSAPQIAAWVSLPFEAAVFPATEMEIGEARVLPTAERRRSRQCDAYEPRTGLCRNAHANHTCPVNS